jgi:ribosomal protein S7
VPREYHSQANIIIAGMMMTPRCQRAGQAHRWKPDALALAILPVAMSKIAHQRREEHVKVLEMRVEALEPEIEKLKLGSAAVSEER